MEYQQIDLFNDSYKSLQDLSKEIIEMIDTHIKLDKRRYEQLSLF